MGKATVKYCPKCSGIKKKDLKGILDADAVATGCIGKCLKKNPDLDGKAFAKIDGKLVVCDSKKKLVKKMVKARERG